MRNKHDSKYVFLLRDIIRAIYCTNRESNALSTNPTSGSLNAARSSRNVRTTPPPPGGGAVYLINYERVSSTAWALPLNPFPLFVGMSLSLIGFGAGFTTG